MSFRYLIAFAFAVVLASIPVSSAGAEEQTVTVGDLLIHSPWSRATPKSAKVGAGYLQIENTGDVPDRLIKVESVIAGHAEMHTMSMSNGVMKMRRLADGVDIPPGDVVTLKPGGDHIMFMKLAGPIKKDQPFKATLTFQRAGVVEVMFQTVKIGGTLHRGSH